MLEEVRWQKVSSESMLQKATKRLVQVQFQLLKSIQLLVDVMKEVGIDISSQKPKDLTEDMMRNATTIINMGCMDDKYLSSIICTKSYRLGYRRSKRQANRES